jgi:flagellar basal-body rod protein FlgB
MSTIKDYFGLNEQSLQLRNSRLELLSQNIANAATPNYRARDIDFAAAMKRAGSQMNLAATQQSHLRLSPMQANLAGGAIVYRVPLNPSVDNNTVEMGVEQAKFGRAAAEYQASLQFLENRISGLRKAIRGD